MSEYIPATSPSPAIPATISVTDSTTISSVGSVDSIETETDIHEWQQSEIKYRIHQELEAKRKETGWNDETEMIFLEDLRNEAKKREGYKSFAYTHLNTKLSTLGRKNRPDARRVEYRKRVRKEDEVDPKQFIKYQEKADLYKKISHAPVEIFEQTIQCHGGCALRYINIPTDDEAKSFPHYKQSCRTVEGGILNVEVVGLSNDREKNCIPDEEKDRVISIVGLGFHRGKGKGFEDVDAKVTHDLIYNSKYSKTTLVGRITYTYLDGRKTMRILAGVMILSLDSSLRRHTGDKTVQCQDRTCRVCNLVQITTLPEYRGRGLANHAIRALKPIMKKFRVDLIWWFGCNREYYDKCGFKSNPEMIDVPFRTNFTDAEMEKEAEKSKGDNEAKESNGDEWVDSFINLHWHKKGNEIAWGRLEPNEENGFGWIADSEGKFGWGRSPNEKPNEKKEFGWIFDSEGKFGWGRLPDVKPNEEKFGWVLAAESQRPVRSVINGKNYMAGKNFHHPSVYTSTETMHRKMFFYMEVPRYVNREHKSGKKRSRRDLKSCDESGDESVGTRGKKVCKFKDLVESHCNKKSEEPVRRYFSIANKNDLLREYYGNKDDEKVDDYRKADDGESVDDSKEATDSRKAEDGGSVDDSKEATVSAEDGDSVDESREAAVNKKEANDIRKAEDGESVDDSKQVDDNKKEVDDGEAVDESKEIDIKVNGKVGHPYSELLPHMIYNVHHRGDEKVVIAVQMPALFDEKKKWAVPNMEYTDSFTCQIESGDDFKIILYGKRKNKMGQTVTYQDEWSVPALSEERISFLLHPDVSYIVLDYTGMKVTV